MAFGDTGGAVTELVLTCKTREEGNVNIKKGDAVSLIGDYIVTNGEHSAPLFGQALADCNTNAAAIPVRVRGVSVFQVDPARFDNLALQQGYDGVRCAHQGRILFCCGVNNPGNKIIRVNYDTGVIHVLH